MPTLNMLYRHEYAINDKITIRVPYVGEVLEDEDEYYSIVTLLTATPYDLMVELDDMGLDFTSMSDYDLFLIVFMSIRGLDTRYVFGDLDLAKFNLELNPQNNKPILVDHENDIVIDRAIQGQIAATLRKIHHLERNKRKPANEEARKYLLERARAKKKRSKNRLQDSELESLIIAMVNTEQYKYNYEETLSLTIYQFNESVKQIIKKVDYEHVMNGVYFGTVDYKGLSQDEKNWLIHK